MLPAQFEVLGERDASQRLSHSNKSNDCPISAQFEQEDPAEALQARVSGFVTFEPEIEIQLLGFSGVLLLPDLLNRLAGEKVVEVLCLAPDNIPAHLQPQCPMPFLRAQRTKIPLWQASSLLEVLRVFRLLRAKNVYVIKGVTAAIRWSSTCDEIHIGDYFGLLGVIVAFHAYPILNAEALASAEPILIFRVLMLYCLFCYDCQTTANGRLDLPSVLQVTWVRNPGPTGVNSPNAVIQGCLALGCSVTGKTQDERDTIFATKSKQLTYHWPEAQGESPMQMWFRKHERLQNNGSIPAGWVNPGVGYSWCAEGDPWSGLGPLMKSTLKPHTFTFQFGSVAVEARAGRPAYLSALNNSNGFVDIDRVFVKEMCQNCDSLANGADIVDVGAALHQGSMHQNKPPTTRLKLVAKGCTLPFKFDRLSITIPRLDARETIDIRCGHGADRSSQILLVSQMNVEQDGNAFKRLVTVKRQGREVVMIGVPKASRKKSRRTPASEVACIKLAGTASWSSISSYANELRAELVRDGEWATPEPASTFTHLVPHPVPSSPGFDQRRRCGLPLRGTRSQKWTSTLTRSWTPTA
ncbi:hypothetical protein GGX14DRAFT_390566 [Mycena pura]|uniref:Uncharacterized protein n=1 Tax=Mycena pura TaxID=153505 RepID=A0AAD6VNU0_9AGAR|nr:hypothetical protein GGX14DRAFT_390566 [Mycena pura]